MLVCAGVALVQAGIGLAVRHGTPPRLLRVSRPRARTLLAAGIAVGLVIALAAGAPSRLSHAWRDFKNSQSATLNQDTLARFGNVSGNGRYDYWKVAVNASGGHLLGGSGLGTYQLVWAPRAPYYSYVVNAHSLYVETLAEDGVIGLGLLVGFFVLVIGAAVRIVSRTRDEVRARAAGAAAALIAFAVSAIAHWVWQMPVLPAAFLLLAAAVLAPASRGGPVGRLASDPAPASTGSRARRNGLVLRVGFVLAALASMIAIAIPLATTSTVRQSLAAATARNTSLALADARTAARVDPSAASPQVQTALVLELQGNYTGALAAARKAAADEPTNWSVWLVASRLKAESGNARGSVSNYRRARSLNPRSPLFPR